MGCVCVRAPKNVGGGTQAPVEARAEARRSVCAARWADHPGGGWPRALICTGPMVVPLAVLTWPAAPAGLTWPAAPAGLTWPAAPAGLTWPAAPAGCALSAPAETVTRTATTPSRRQNRTLPPSRLVTDCDRTFTEAAYRSAARGGSPVGFLP